MEKLHRWSKIFLLFCQLRFRYRRISFFHHHRFSHHFLEKMLSHRGLSMLYWKLLLHLFNIVENSLFLELWLLEAKMVLHINWCGNCHHWCKQSLASSIACYYLVVRWLQDSCAFEDMSLQFAYMWLKHLVSIDWVLTNWSNFIHKHMSVLKASPYFLRTECLSTHFDLKSIFLLYLLGTNKYQTLGLCPNLLDTLSIFMHPKTFYPFSNMKISCFHESKLNKLKLFHINFMNLVSSIILNVSRINFCKSIHSKSFIY